MTRILLPEWCRVSRRSRARWRKSVQPILTELRSFVSEFTAAGEDMVRGIWQGFQNMSGWLESRVRAMMREIVAAGEDENGDRLPRRKYLRDIGAYMAQGLWRRLRAGNARRLKNLSERQRTTPFPMAAIRARARAADPETHFEGVVQNMYANETLLRPATARGGARQFRMIAREVIDLMKIQEKLTYTNERGRSGLSFPLLTSYHVNFKDVSRLVRRRERYLLDKRCGAGRRHLFRIPH